MATESNRDKARRGGWGTGEVLSVGFNVSLGGVPDPVSRAKPGGTVMVRSAPNALTKRHTVLMIDPAMFSDPAKGERFALEGLTLLLYVGRARFALTIGAGDTEKTICENARCLLAAAGLDQHVRIQWCEQEQSASDGGHLQHGREVADHAEMTRTFGASQDGDGPAHPDPAPGQVWLPPVGAVNGYTFEPTPMLADADGTLTVGCVDPLTPPSVVWNGSGSDGQTRETNVEDITDPANGWTCIGVATPHGRVMVGDGFTCTGPSHVYDAEVVGVLDGERVLMRYTDGSQGDLDAILMLKHEWPKRTRYAPARAGERYRAGGGYCAEPETVDAATAGRQFDATAWERLDPWQDGDGQTIKIKRPASVVEAERVRLKIDVSSDPLPELSLSVAPQPHTVIVRDGARLTPEQVEGVVAGHMRVFRTNGRAVEEVARCASPATATGADLDAIASGMGIERREAIKPSGAMGPPTFVGKPADRSLNARDTLTLAAPARDLRALFDAIGRALEASAPHSATVAGRVYLVMRDEMLFLPEVAPAADVLVITADTKHLHALRRAVRDAMANGAAYRLEWGNGLTVERVGGPLVTAQPAPEPAATHYDGAQGGPDAWRWEVAE